MDKLNKQEDTLWGKNINKPFLDRLGVTNSKFYLSYENERDGNLV